MLLSLILAAALNSNLAPAHADAPRLAGRAASGLLLPALKAPIPSGRLALGVEDPAKAERIDQAAQLDAHYAGQTMATVLAVIAGIAGGGVAGGLGGFALASNIAPGFGSDPVAGVMMFFLLPAGGALLGAAAGGVLAGILTTLLYPRFEYRPDGALDPHTGELPRNVLSLAVLHPLSGIYSLEYERRVSDAATVFVAPRALYRRASGSNEGGVGGALGGRWYFAGLAPRGFFAEGAVHVRHRQLRRYEGAVTTNRYDDLSFGGAVSVGVAFLLARHVSISFGLGIEGEQIWWDYASTSPADPIPAKGSRFALHPHGRASLGFAF